MTSSTISWQLVDRTADALGATEPARRKWRQRGVPHVWRIKIVEQLMSEGVPLALGEFRKLELTSGEMAA
jgi:hypothetical protein